MRVAPSQRAPLEQRFRARVGRVHLTGLQALARVPLDQVRRDRAAGRRVGGFVSGYPGSPLAGFDPLLSRIANLLEEHDLHFQLGLNEELAAAAVSGSQFVDLFPHPRFAGAIGMWFGKAPGVDRCLDVLRHANFAGISRFGGALAAAGDDPDCKSSSLPSQSELAFAHAQMPLLVPDGAAQVLELGLHGYALSRYAGLWVGMKLVADVCDGGEILELPDLRVAPVLPHFEWEGRPFEKRLDPRLLPPMVREIERELVFARLEAARRYAYANDLDRILESRPGDRVGFVAAGVHARELATAFRLLGLDERARARLGIRVLQLALVHPVEARRLREFARGLESVVVLDDRRDFLETQVRSLLYGEPGSPHVLGQRDAEGRPWLSARGALTPESLARDLAPFLARWAGEDGRELARRGAELATRALASGPLPLARRPHFCSGCPHLESTRLPEGAAAAGGIGCHTMALLSEREMRFVGAMGSEGAHWNGLAPFVETPHLFQNLGDGTYFHSGRQAIRACVAAGRAITFKLLWNGAIAMTGGQRATGEKPLAPVLDDLLSDGVARVIAMTADPAVRALTRADARVEVVARDGSQAAMARLAREPGVTVFVYDALCANEKQRQQRRGALPGPERRLFIQRDVCEGCGDCGRKSECLSLHPVETVLGRKTEIHQGSCSQDEVCARGDCPAFVSLPGGLELAPLPLPQSLREEPPEPERPSVEDATSLLLVGIGSTGVVTVDAILVGAALAEGLFALHVDQTGLSQRGGRVSSHLRLSRQPLGESGRVPQEGADVLLAFDPLGAAAPESLARISPERTRSVVHDALAPTADMLSHPEAPAPSLSFLRDRIAKRSRDVCSLPAEALATALLGTHQCANVLLLGFAFQRGLIPLASQAIEASMRDLGVAVEINLSAFRLGRALARHPEVASQVLVADRPPSVGEEGDPRRAFELYGGAWQEIEGLLGGRDPASGLPLATLVAGWACDLRDYQSFGYGARYLRTLLPLLREEVALGADEAPLAATAARELYRLMAYKDEYEVARLHLRGPWRRWLERRAGRRARPTFWLHPPLLRAIGLRHKLRLGPWFAPFLGALAALRFLRGTPFDPFGRTRARRLERELVVWYEDLLRELTERLEAIGVAAATSIAACAADIRGYEELKLERAARVRERVAKELDLEAYSASGT